IHGARLEDRVARRAGLADNLDVVLVLQQQPQARADDRVVVDDEHPDAHPSGTSIFSVVPAFLRDSTLRVPPSSATRSRMPSMPKPPSRVCAGSNPRPSSSTRAVTMPPFRASTMLTFC